MNPQNINLEPPVHDEVMNLHEKPVDGKERSLSSTSILGENNNNGLLFAPTCTTCFNENKYLLMSEKKCSHQWTNECLNKTGKYILFPSEMYHHGDTIIRNPTKFSPKRNYSVPQPTTPMPYDSHDP
jgi:hypothetical protein